jgi:hypothetical protein
MLESHLEAVLMPQDRCLCRLVRLPRELAVMLQLELVLVQPLVAVCCSLQALSLVASDLLVRSTWLVDHPTLEVQVPST